MEPHYYPFLFIMLVAVLAPLVNELPFRFRMPSVVLEIAGGIVVGPQVLGLVRPDAAVQMVWTIGMAFLFLLVGTEIDFARLRGRPLRLATFGWAMSLALAAGIALMLRALGLVESPILVALALTTTAAGTLLPILRDSGDLSRNFGVLTLAAGTLGEFGPLFMLTLLPLGGHTVTGNALVIVGFAIIATLAALFVLYVQPPALVAVLKRTLYKSSQLPVRLVLLLMGGLGVIAAELGLEFLVGAFAAGMIVGMVTRGEEAEPFRQKLDGLGFGFLIAVFFVVTGVKFDLNALLGSTLALLCLPLFLALFLLVRGLPVLLYRGVLGVREQLALAFYSACALPVVVAITQIGVATNQMKPEIAAALVGAGMISLLIYPQLAAIARPPLEARPEEAAGKKNIHEKIGES